MLQSPPRTALMPARTSPSWRLGRHGSLCPPLVLRASVTPTDRSLLAHALAPSSRDRSDGSGPTTVLVLSLLFIAFVVLLHVSRPTRALLLMLEPIRLTRQCARSCARRRSGASSGPRSKHSAIPQRRRWRGHVASQVVRSWHSQPLAHDSRADAIDQLARSVLGQEGKEDCMCKSVPSMPS